MAPRAGVRGGAQLASAFRQIANAASPAARRKARQEGLEPIKTAARDFLELNSSVVTGALVASLAIGEDDGKANRSILGQRTGKVRGYFPAKYAHLVEFSVKPHYQPRRFGGIMHPGHPGYPFMRPALDEQKAAAAQRYANVMIGQVLAVARNVPKITRGS